MIPEITFLKISSIRLNADELLQLLEDWDSRVEWTEPFEHPSTHRRNPDRKNTFLQEWISDVNLHPEALEWLIEKHGLDMFIEERNNESSIFEYLLLPSRIMEHGDCIASFINRMSKEDFCATIEKKLHAKNDEKDYSILGPDRLVKGDMAVILYFSRYGCFNVLDAYLEKWPEALHAVHDGITVGALMGAGSDGWDIYLKHGGSPFDKVHTHPISGEQGEDTPLWHWLMRRKNYHPSLEKTMSELLVRLSEGREPLPGDFILSNEDWQELVDNKPKIMAEIRMTEFESKINIDWKSAIKENKEWRKWRNSEGGNFMFWLGSKSPAHFIRQAHKTKLNHGLIMEEDLMGRNMMHYLLVGIFTEGLGTYSSVNKLSGEPWKETLATLSTMIPTSPQRGVMADWTNSDEKAYFGQIRRHFDINCNVKIASTFLKENPAYFWNGMRGDCLKRLFENSKSISMAENLMVIGGDIAEGPIRDYVSTLDEMDKFRLGVFLSGATVYRKIQSPAMAVFSDIIENVANFPMEKLNLEEVQEMSRWMKSANKNRYSYLRTEEISKTNEAFLEKTVMHLEIYRNRTEQDMAPVKKRLM